MRINDGTKTPQNEYVNRPTPLEALERAKREHYDLNQGFPDSEYIEELNNIETALKALEIIKEKKVHMIWLLCSMTNFKGTNKEQLDNYNAQLDYSAVPHRIKLYLTQEEYDLLKEILE